MSSNFNNKNTIEYHTIEWNKIIVNIEYIRNYYPDFYLAHLVLKTINDEPIPVTSTGYRSYFAPYEEIEADGTVVDYVKDWLEQEEQKESWKNYLTKMRQPTLF